MVSTYESIIVFRPELPQEEIDKIIAKFEKMIVDDGGEVIKLERGGIKKTSYPIGKYRDGFFTYMKYQAASAVVNSVRRVLQVTDGVIRNITTKVEKPRRIKTKKEKVKITPAPVSSPQPEAKEEK